MKKEDLKYFKELLEKKRAEVLKNIEYLRRVALDSTNQEASGDHSAYSFHMADQGTDAMEREKAFLFASIENGTYGICRVTGKEIGRERLEAVPTTTISYEAKLKESKSSR
jgi:RNA polymerase-binding transcription factor DksA